MTGWGCSIIHSPLKLPIAKKIWSAFVKPSFSSFVLFSASQFSSTFLHYSLFTSHLRHSLYFPAVKYIQFIYNAIERCYMICAATCIAFSMPSPDVVLPPSFLRQNLDSSPIMALPHIHFRCSWHQPKQAWRWRAGIAGITGFLAAFLAWSLAMCSLFLTIWSEICLWYHCAHLDCKSLETYSSSMKQGWVFLGCFLPSRPTLPSVFDTSLTELGPEFGNDARTDIKYGCHSACLNTRHIYLCCSFLTSCTSLWRWLISLSNNINTTPVVLIEGPK